jgi:hypothetical protein
MNAIGFKEFRDGSLGEVMVSCELVRGDARLILCDDLVDLCVT